MIIEKLLWLIAMILNNRLYNIIRGSKMTKGNDPTIMIPQQVVNRKGGLTDTLRTMTDQMINPIHSFIHNIIEIFTVNY